MRLNFNLGGFVEVALPCSKNRKLFVAEVIDVQEDEVLFRYMKAARGGFKWPTVEDVSWEHHSSVTRHLDNPVLDIQKIKSDFDFITGENPVLDIQKSSNGEYPVLDIQKSSNRVQIF
ncbi:hypothetical protein MAR_018119, partial [Mya arenaria]